jgi:hypothetical protein
VTLILAIIQGISKQEFYLLYVGTFILDILSLMTIYDIFVK